MTKNRLGNYNSVKVNWIFVACHKCGWTMNVLGERVLYCGFCGRKMMQKYNPRKCLNSNCALNGRIQDENNYCVSCGKRLREKASRRFLSWLRGLIDADTQEAYYIALREGVE